jgi:hypothetical protein
LFFVFSRVVGQSFLQKTGKTGQIATDYTRGPCPVNVASPGTRVPC